ncbi:MAG: [FeFe] hydrogenase H-cluster maturation GTPase HydF, partial [Desulfovibrio sp.]|nr:[FeFe] hydrogenase H-cluster maturation GTPase HydF [Desulfovibrio sp.]
MTLNDTPSGERIHISFFGLRNAGKSSLVNAFLGQNLCIVSPVRGTTTDPVSKAMELLPLGPVLVTDTPGVDDEGELGNLRQKKAFDAIAGTDVAVLVTDAQTGLSPLEQKLLETFKKMGVPCIRARSKADLLDDCPRDDIEAECPEIWTSAVKGWGVRALKETIAALKRPQKEAPGLVDGIARPGDTALLVVPIDSAAPKGRLILPQQQVIRDLLDMGARALVVKEDGIGDALASLSAPPACAVTDSQVFAKAAQAVPESVPLTSFSILMARRKGFLEEAVRGVASVASLKDGDTVLIAEGCTHHRQCGDIGTVKIPRWLRQSTGKRLQFKTVSGREFPDDCTPYALVVCCGGCMLSAREVASRIRCATRSGVPATNFGVLIASMQGVLERSLSVFPHLARLLGKPQGAPQPAHACPCADASAATGKAFPASHEVCLEAPDGMACRDRGSEAPFAKALCLIWEAFLRTGEHLPPQEAEGMARARQAVLARMGLADPAA